MYFLVIEKKKRNSSSILIVFPRLWQKRESTFGFRILNVSCPSDRLFLCHDLFRNDPQQLRVLHRSYVK